MKYYNDIKKWDDTFCINHVINLVRTIGDTFKENGIKELHYLDIGANVGKVYDLLNEYYGVKKVWMYEASPILFEYLNEKYQNDEKVSVDNVAVFDTEGVVNFDQSSILNEIKNNQSNLNLGLSKIGESVFSTQVRSIKISDVIRKSEDIKKNVNFIKIDTESVDFNILDDIYGVIDLFEKKPIIEFEINYFVSRTPIEVAQNILDKYRDIGYNEISLLQTQGDGVLIPINK